MSIQPCCEHMTVGGMCDVHGRYGDFVALSGDVEALKETRPGQRFEVVSDLELERRALKACGYRVHVKERNGTRWLMAVKGLGVRYEHWHPLTNINQAMQLLCECPNGLVALETGHNYVTCFAPMYSHDGHTVEVLTTGRQLMDAQCRAIVTACASLKPVR